MGAEKFSAVMGVLVEQVVYLITENYAYDELTASNEFYNSKVYALLEQEETKLCISALLPCSICLMKKKRQAVLNCQRRFNYEQSRKIYDLLCRAI